MTLAVDDADSDDGVSQIDSSGDVDADTIAEDLMPRSGEEHSVRRIARDEIARTRARPANRVVRPADPDRGEACAVSQSDGSGDVGTDVIPEDLVALSSGIRQMHTISTVARDDVARTGA